MKDAHSRKRIEPVSNKPKSGLPVFNIMLVMLLVTITGVFVLLNKNQPSVNVPVSQITFEQKMAHLQNGSPLPDQQARPVIPRWIIVLVLAFLVIQILPLLVASRKAQAAVLNRRAVRQIEFLTETPMFLGLLGSLLGVCLTQFISGSLAAPLAYLTSISGILLYLFGRFMILADLPVSNDLSQE